MFSCSVLGIGDVTCSCRGNLSILRYVKIMIHKHFSPANKTVCVNSWCGFTKIDLAGWFSSPDIIEQGLANYSWDVCVIFLNLFIDLRETTRERQWETSTFVCCYIHLCIYWLTPVCALTGDWTCNLVISEWCCDQLSYPATATVFLEIKFYWNTDRSIHMLSMTAFTLQQQSWVWQRPRGLQSLKYLALEEKTCQLML